MPNIYKLKRRYSGAWAIVVANDATEALRLAGWNGRGQRADPVEIACLGEYRGAHRGSWLVVKEGEK